MKIRSLSKFSGYVAIAGEQFLHHLRTYLYTETNI